MPRLLIALPLLNENELLSRLILSISRQTFRNFRVFACVNQPDEWWDDPECVTVCRENQKTIQYLKTIHDFPVVVIDRSSRGKGWQGKKHGVGWARKVAMDAANETADSEDIIVSLDGDTVFSEKYFQSLVDLFKRNPDAKGVAVPYFHKPVDDHNAYRAILRYEIYMRYYCLNLWRIGSHYPFAALGSAMVCPIHAYRAVGGMTPKMSGEDFYFLQKLRKYGKLLFWNEEKVYPMARFSNRVYFGTGPAMIKGNEGDWSSYPVYPYRFFDEIHEIYKLFPDFYTSTGETPVISFIRQQFREEDPFEPLRRNFIDKDLFVKACHEKFDGLRALQYLKMRQDKDPVADEQSIKEFLDQFYPEQESIPERILENLSFNDSSLEDLEKIRMFLMSEEEKYQVSSALS